MFHAVKGCWALFLGLGLMMLGNGLHGTLLGVRAKLESFPNGLTGIVMSGYYVGFLLGSMIVPKLVNSVGHVRTFGALAGLASTAVLLHPVFVDPISWGIMRILTGFSYAGLYIVCESWVNNASTNETRGQMLSFYMLVIFGALCLSQLLLNVADPSSFELFTLISVLISVAVVPILVSATPAPSYEASENASMLMLYQVSPLGVVGLFFTMMGQAILFSLGGVYAAEVGMSVPQISLFMLMMFVGGLLFQWPIGKLSDIFDRRQVIAVVAFLSAATGVGCVLLEDNYIMLLVMFGLLGGLSSPLYSLCLAHTNDYLNPQQMVAASGTLVLVSGLGAIFGPPAAAFAMEQFAADSFFWGTSVCFALIGVFALYRMTRRASLPQAEQGDYVAMAPTPNTAGLNPEFDGTEWNPCEPDHPDTVEELFEEFLTGEDDLIDEEEDRENS
ncbi:MFS transporter [Aestuariispira insulae]|uniref:MFS transporter n=1 Tax=Aestuariispira insulae TaxID=1461337 RepID=A0A3D9HF17_9PROT|nr:MFS transporter [Aestuariispira insulae]RED48082.1 MFS transporter [Aestuariispira insulae]